MKSTLVNHQEELEQINDRESGIPKKNGREKFCYRGECLEVTTTANKYDRQEMVNNMES